MHHPPRGTRNLALRFLVPALSLPMCGALLSCGPRYSAGIACEERDPPIFAVFTAVTVVMHAPPVETPEHALQRLRDLLDAGADPNARNARGDTALMYADESDRPRIDLMLERGARVDLRDAGGRTPLMRIRHRPSFGEPILARVKEIDARDNNGRTALSWAAENACFGDDLVKRLLAAGAAVDAPDHKGWTPLMHAVESVYASRAIHLLLDHGADPARGGWTPLMLAAMTDDRPTLARLIAEHADLEARDHEGRTALHWAARSFASDVRIVSVNDGVIDTTSPFAAEQEARLAHRLPIHLLLDAGANIEARDGSGRTPLIHAVEARDESNAELLLARGADPNAQDDAGLTALMRVAERLDDRLIKPLLARGARPDLQDHEGLRAADHARRRYPEARVPEGLEPPEPRRSGPTRAVIR